MERVAVGDLPDADDRARVVRLLTGPLGATDLALNYFELAPGESPALGYHAHPDQEELFYVLDGTVTFETGDPEAEGEGEGRRDTDAESDTEGGPTRVEVSAGEAVRFAPGEYQRGWNRGERVARLLAVGAPRSTEAADVRRPCPDCGERTPVDFDPGDDLVMRCGRCGTETGRLAR